MKEIFRKALAASLCCIATAPAAAADYSIAIIGDVPVSCRVTMESAPAGNGLLGRLQEFCNSGRGYQVYVDHSPELAKATMIVDGREVRLSDSGSTLLTESSSPAIVTRMLALQGASNGSISFRIVPL